MIQTINANGHLIHLSKLHYGWSVYVDRSFLGIFETELKAMQAAGIVVKTKSTVGQ